MRRKKILASTFLAVTLAAATAAADHRWNQRNVRPGQLNREQYFNYLDRNHDGWLAPHEYDDREFPFAWADVDGNGFLSRNEWRDSRPAIRNARSWYQFAPSRADSQRLSEFLRLDRNNDEFLTVNEWGGRPWTFGQLDRDNDGLVHVTEYLR